MAACLPGVSKVLGLKHSTIKQTKTVPFAPRHRHRRNGKETARRDPTMTLTFDPTTTLHCSTELRFLLPFEEFILDLAVSNCPFCKLMLKVCVGDSGPQPCTHSVCKSVNCYIKDALILAKSDTCCKTQNKKHILSDFFSINIPRHIFSPSQLCFFVAFPSNDLISGWSINL